MRQTIKTKCEYFFWGIAVRQFCVFACYSGSQNIYQSFDGTTIHSQFPSDKLPGNCSVIVVDLKPRPVSKGTGCVDVPGVSVFYGVQSLKELLGVQEIDALMTLTLGSP